MIKKYLNIAFLIKILLVIFIYHNSINCMKNFLRVKKHVPIVPALMKRAFSSSLPKFSSVPFSQDTKEKNDEEIFPIDEDNRELIYSSRKNYKLSDAQMDRFIAIGGVDSLVDYTISEALTEIENDIHPSLTNHKLDIALIRAAAINEEELVQFLIESGATASYKDFCQQTALFAAVYNQCTDLFEILLGAGADINAQDYTGTSILMVSSYFFREDIVRWLISKGANVNAKDNSGRTALIRSAEYNLSTSVQFAKLLIEANVDINAQDNNGNTALMTAVFHENLKMVQFLIKSNANIYAKNNQGDTVFSMIVNNLSKLSQNPQDHENIYKYKIMKIILDKALMNQKFA